MNETATLVALLAQVVCLYGVYFGPASGFWTFVGVFSLFVVLAGALDAFYRPGGSARDPSWFVRTLGASLAYLVVSWGLLLFVVWPIRALLVAFGVLS